MPVITAFIQKFAEGTELSAHEVAEAVRELTQESVASETKADFLSALAQKGETVGEITAFAHELRERAVVPPIDAGTRAGVIVDVCGTGGDRLHTFNISTTVALILAASGVTVAKHGNRAITSRAGSADVMEALGVPTDLSPRAAALSLRDHQFAFFFAPQYHPAFKHIAPARRLCADRQQRTIFNYLGPLLNPARPSAQLIGVPEPQLCEPIAKVLQFLGVPRGMVVSGRTDCGWMDELSTMGETVLAEFYQEKGFNVSTTSFVTLVHQTASLAALAGGEASANAQWVRGILNQQDQGPRRDIVLLNAAAGLLVAGRAPSITEGCALAANLIDSGQAAAKLDALIASGPALKKIQ